VPSGVSRVLIGETMTVSGPVGTSFGSTGPGPAAIAPVACLPLGVAPSIIPGIIDPMGTAWARLPPQAGPLVFMVASPLPDHMVIRTTFLRASWSDESPPSGLDRYPR
jgi:hypothetical protein